MLWWKEALEDPNRSGLAGQGMANSQLERGQNSLEGGEGRERREFVPQVWSAAWSPTPCVHRSRRIQVRPVARSSRQPPVRLQESGERGGPRIEGPRIGRQADPGRPGARGGATREVPSRLG